MLPLSLFELGQLNDISSVINFGSLPFIVSSIEPKSDLKDYVQLYRKVVMTSKLYFFDLGVCNYLQRRLEIKKWTPKYEKAFEHLVFNELKAFQNYNYDNKIELFFWRTQNHLEVDFILEIENQLFAIEIKSTAHPRLEELPGLRAFGEAVPNAKKLVVCHISRSYTEQEIYF